MAEDYVEVSVLDVARITDKAACFTDSGGETWYPKSQLGPLPSEYPAKIKVTRWFYNKMMDEDQVEKAPTPAQSDPIPVPDDDDIPF